jgi:hypothetical protein
MNDEICRTALLTWQPHTGFTLYTVGTVQYFTQKQSESKKHIMIITYRYFSIFTMRKLVYAFSYCKEWRKGHAKDQRNMKYSFFVSN